MRKRSTDLWKYYDIRMKVEHKGVMWRPSTTSVDQIVVGFRAETYGMAAHSVGRFSRSRPRPSGIHGVELAKHRANPSSHLRGALFVGLLRCQYWGLFRIDGDLQERC